MLAWMLLDPDMFVSAQYEGETESNRYLLLANIYGIYDTDIATSSTYSRPFSGESIQLLWNDADYLKNHDVGRYESLRGEYNGYKYWYGQCCILEPGIFTPGDIQNLLACYDKETRFNIGITQIFEFLLNKMYSDKNYESLTKQLINANKEIYLYDFRYGNSKKKKKLL